MVNLRRKRKKNEINVIRKCDFVIDFTKEEERYAMRHEIEAELAPWFAERSLDQVSQALDKAGACWGPYQTVLQALENDPDLSTENPMFEEVHQPGIGTYIAAGSFVEIEDPECEEKYLSLASPVKFHDSDVGPKGPAPLLGEHNVRNTTAAIAIALNLGIKVQIIKKSLKNFVGVERRYNKIFSYRGVDFYDDYAHHPTEIKAVLNSARQVYTNRKIICVFQPHRYSRVKLLKKEFASSFKLSDLLVLCPVYSAGEKEKYQFDQRDFSKLIANKSNVQVLNIKDQYDLKKFIKKNLFKNEMLICMGAGSISNWIRNISNDL